MMMMMAMKETKLKAADQEVMACRKHGFEQSQCDLVDHSLFRHAMLEEWHVLRTP